MEKESRKNRNLFSIINYIILAMSLIIVICIMVNGYGVMDTLDFGAGAYYYADIPEFSKYTDEVRYLSPTPVWVLIVLFFIWGIFMYKIWGWLEKKENHK